MFTKWQIDRFWSHVEIKSDNECWNWKLSTDRDGYGKSQMDLKFQGAHRVAYQIANGTITDGKQVLHTCDNRRCCNPSHLYVGGVVENVRDAIERGRRAKTYKNPKKMNQVTADNLRNDFVSGASKRALSRMYGITTAHVRDILRGRYWKTPSSPTADDS